MSDPIERFRQHLISVKPRRAGDYTNSDVIDDGSQPSHSELLDRAERRFAELLEGIDRLSQQAADSFGGEYYVRFTMENTSVDDRKVIGRIVATKPGAQKDIGYTIQGGNIWIDDPAFVGGGSGSKNNCYAAEDATAILDKLVSALIQFYR